jgi:hypothetical protein
MISSNSLAECFVPCVSNFAWSILGFLKNRQFFLTTGLSRDYLFAEPWRGTEFRAEGGSTDRRKEGVSSNPKAVWGQRIEKTEVMEGNEVLISLRWAFISLCRVFISLRPVLISLRPVFISLCRPRQRASDLCRLSYLQHQISKPLSCIQNSGCLGRLRRCG